MDVLPDALGAARLECGDGGWRLSEAVGEVDTSWALQTLRAGEAVLYEESVEAGGDEVEVIARREDLHVVVADGRRAVVLRMPRDANVGLALGFAHQHVRTGQG